MLPNHSSDRESCRKELSFGDPLQFQELLVMKMYHLAYVEALSKISSYPDSNMALYILYTRHCQGACGTQSSPS